MGIKEDFYEQYDDLLFRALMSEVAKEEGKRLIAENERLKADPSFEMPETVYKNGLKTIRRAFREKAKKTAGRKAGRIIYRVAVVIVLIILILAIAVVAFPELKEKAVSHFMNTFETHTDFVFNNGHAGNDNHTIIERWVPDDYSLEESESTISEDWEMWSNENGNVIFLSKCEPVTQTFDTEDASVESITIQNYAATLIAKGNEIQLIWVNSTNGMVYTVLTVGESRDVALRVAESFI